jgi:hypothetical protein
MFIFKGPEMFLIKTLSLYFSLDKSLFQIIISHNKSQQYLQQQCCAAEVA